MKIQADEEGTKTIQELCNAALLIGGLKNLNLVNSVLSSTRPIELPKKPTKKNENKS